MAGEVLGEIWAVAGAVGPVDVRVFVRGITNYPYRLSTQPQQILAAGVPFSALVIQNLGAFPIEIGNDRGLMYGQGLRIPPNSLLSNGQITPGGIGQILLERFARAALPAPGAPGRLVELTDYDRGIWIDDGATFASLTGQIIDVTRYDARADGVTNDTNAIRAAIAAAGVGDVIRLPPSPCLVGGAAIVSEIFLLPHPVHFIGSGYNSVLLIDAATPAGVDVFRLAPPAPTENAMFYIADFRIIPVAGTPARDAFRIDLSPAGRFLRRFKIERTWLEQIGGNAITLANPIPNLNGLFTCTIEDNFFQGGIDLTNGGDDILIEDNSITGQGQVLVALVAGAGHFLLKKNSISISGGVRITGAAAPRIVDNQMEAQVAYTGANAAYLDVDAVAGIDGVEIAGNLINVTPGPTAIDCVRINGTTSAFLDRNWINHRAGQAGIRIGALSTGTIIDEKNRIFGAGTDVIDASTQTVWHGAPGRYASITDSAAIANTAALSTFNRSHTIPAGTLRVGDVVRIRAMGVYSTLGAGPGNITLQVRLAGQVLCTAVVALVAGQVNATWRVDGEAVIRSIGVGGTMRAVVGLWSISSVTTIGNAGLLTGIDTTIAQVVDAQVQFTVANAANTITMQELYVDIVRAGVTQ